MFYNNTQYKLIRNTKYPFAAGYATVYYNPLWDGVQLIDITD